MNHAKEVASAIQQYFAVMKQPHDDTTKEFLSGCTAKTLSTKAGQYTYHCKGNGPPVLLVHGLHSNLGSMVGIAQDLSEHYKVILFDAPAHGEAKGMTTNQPQVRDFVQELGKALGPLHAVVAHSLGVMWVLSAWGEDLNAKTVVSISAPTSPRFLTDRFIEMNKLTDEVAQGLRQQLERRFGATYWQDYSVPEISKTLDVHGLIIHCKDDMIVPLSHAREIQENWAKSEIRIVEGDEHFGSAGALPIRELVKAHIEQI